MLLIARRIGESVQIGEDVEIRILGASRSRVMVGIAAPHSLRILRIAAEEADSARAAPAERGKRAANETLRQRRLKLTPR